VYKSTSTIPTSVFRDGEPHPRISARVSFTVLKPDRKYLQYNRLHNRVACWCQPGNTHGTNLERPRSSPPFNPGALRAIARACVSDGDGQWVSFHVRKTTVFGHRRKTHRGGWNSNDQRTSASSVPPDPVRVPPDPISQHEGDFFSVLVTPAKPRDPSHTGFPTRSVAAYATRGWAKPTVTPRMAAQRQNESTRVPRNTLDDVQTRVPNLFLVAFPRRQLIRYRRATPLGGTPANAHAPHHPGTRCKRRLTTNPSSPSNPGPRLTSGIGREAVLTEPDRIPDEERTRDSDSTLGLIRSDGRVAESNSPRERFPGRVRVHVPARRPSDCLCYWSQGSRGPTPHRRGPLAYSTPATHPTPRPDAKPWCTRSDGRDDRRFNAALPKKICPTRSSCAFHRYVRCRDNCLLRDVLLRALTRSASSRTTCSDLFLDHDPVAAVAEVL